MTKSKETSLGAPRFENLGPLLIAGLRKGYTGKTASEIPALWQRFAPHIGNIPGQVGQHAYGVVIGTSNDGFDYVAGVEVSDAANVPSELSTLRIPSLRYAIFPHREHVSRLKETMNAIWHEWLPESGNRPAGEPGSDLPGMIEYYAADFDPRTGLGGMEVWLPLKA